MSKREQDEKLEHVIQNEIRNALVDECYLYRANVGSGYTASKPDIFRPPHPMVVNINPGDVLLRNARRFDTGLPEGFADTFGFVPTVITPDMVGTTVAVFLGLEIKKVGGAIRPMQVNFVSAVNNNGGRAGFARSVDEARDIVRGNGNASLHLSAGNGPDRPAIPRPTGEGPNRRAVAGSTRSGGGGSRGG